MTAIVDKFCADYQEYNNISSGRRRIQRKQILALAEHAGKPLENCTPEDVAQFLAHQVREGFHVNTVRKHLGMLRPFFRWGYRQGIYDAEHALTMREVVRAPKGARATGRPRPYNQRELRVFWAAMAEALPPVPGGTVTRYLKGTCRFSRVRKHLLGLEIKAIAMLALHAALRREEIYRLTVDDLHPDNAYVPILGKGGREREVPLTTKCRASVDAWLEARERLLAPSHDRLWLRLNKAGGCDPAGPLSFAGFEMILRYVPGGWSLHRFRHTCATEWLRHNRMPIQQVQRLLGHANVQQTLNYTQLLREDIQESMQKHEDAFSRAVGG